MDWNVHVWTMMTSLYWSVGAVVTLEWACILCGHHIQNDWMSRAEICIKFCVRLDHFSLKTIRMIQKVTAISKWSLANSSQQPIHSCITSYEEFFLWNIKSPRWLNTRTAQIEGSVTSGFSPNSNHLWKGRDFSHLRRFRKIWQGSWWQLGELCEVPKVGLIWQTKTMLPLI